MWSRPEQGGSDASTTAGSLKEAKRGVAPPLLVTRCPRESQSGSGRTASRGADAGATNERRVVGPSRALSSRRYSKGSPSQHLRLLRNVANAAERAMQHAIDLVAPAASAGARPHREHRTTTALAADRCRSSSS